ncbi:hypothetical protein [Nostoc sp. UIC 10630]|nr:hypothetical protein [Nostoc sp. UIC 10630]
MLFLSVVNLLLGVEAILVFLLPTELQAIADNSTNPIILKL